MKDIRFGTVLKFNPFWQNGIVSLADEAKPVPFDLKNYRNVVAGFSEPEFEICSDAVHEIKVGSEIVGELLIEHIKEATCSQKSIRRVRTISIWGLASCYKEALRIIRDRPVFEVVEFTLYNDAPTSRRNIRVIARGTAIELQAEYPKGANNDPLAPELKRMDFTYRRRFYQTNTALRTQCPDPRKVLDGQSPEEFLPTNGDGVLLATPKDIQRELGLVNFRITV